MKLVNVSLLSIVALGVAVGACNKQDDSDEESLGAVESQLVEDDTEASETDDDLEAGLDEPLSGAETGAPGTPADGTLDELVEKVRVNAGKFFRSPGCLESIRDGYKLKHVFKSCRGPYDMGDFDGTIDSTYAFADGKLTITHQASGFIANGASITGLRIVEYTRDGSLITKTRHGSWSGATAKGKPISHEANFVSTYDAAARCSTRDGSAQTSVANRSFERTIDGYKRCGIGRLGCPDSGSISLTRTKGDQSASVSIEFLGGARYKVTRPNGRELTRLLVCRPNAS